MAWGMGNPEASSKVSPLRPHCRTSKKKKIQYLFTDQLVSKSFISKDLEEIILVLTQDTWCKSKRQFKWKSWFLLHLFLPLLPGKAQQGAGWSTRTSTSRGLPEQYLTVVSADRSAVAWLLGLRCSSISPSVARQPPGTTSFSARKSTRASWLCSWISLLLQNKAQTSRCKNPPQYSWHLGVSEIKACY